MSAVLSMCLNRLTYCNYNKNFTELNSSIIIIITSSHVLVSSLPSAFGHKGRREEREIERERESNPARKASA